MSRKALLIALFASLALNLFAIGAVVGGLVIGARMHGVREEARRGGAPLWAAAQSLEPDQRRAFRTALRRQSMAVAGDLRAARQARREAWLSLGAEPFDAKAAAAELDRARALEAQARAGVEHGIVDFAAGLPPAERARLAEALARSGPPAGPRFRRGPSPEGAPPGAPAPPP